MSVLTQGLNRSIAPVISEFEDFDIQRAEGVFLGGKIPAYFVHSPIQPLVQLEFVFHAGSIVENIPNTSGFAVKMLQEGTFSHSAKYISDKIAYHGAFLELTSGTDRSYVTLYCLTEHLANVLPLVYELITEASFPVYEFENLRNVAVQYLKVNHEKNAYIASGLFREALFGKGHPYGHFSAPEELAQTQLEDCAKHYRTYIQQSPYELVASGDINDRVKNLLESIFGRNPPNNHAVFVTEQVSLSRTAERIYMEKSQSLQSSLRLGRITIPKKHPDYTRLMVTNEIFGGYFGSRLMKNIREEKGYTYGIHSSVTHLGTASYWQVGADVKKESLDDTFTEIYRELKKLQTTPVGEHELQMVKNYMIGQFLGSITTPFSLAEKFKSVHFHGLDYGYYHHYIGRINEVTPEDILETAQKYLPTGSFTEVAVG